MALNVNSTQLGLFGSGQIPKEGLKSIGPVPFDWSTKGVPGNANAINIDFRALQTTSALISQSLSMYVDNSLVNSPITFLFDSGQSMVFPAKSQGYLPIAQGNPIRFSASCALGAGVTTVMLYNYEITPYIWSVP